MKNLNARIRDIPIPPRLARLPISDAGFPVPWFVAWLDGGRPAPRGNGKPDFRVLYPGAVKDAHQRRLCWLCGAPRGVFGAFVIGPMCAINRVSAEPPSHRECAEYAVKACPFLSQPGMRRNEKNLPAGCVETEGMIKRNPGVMLIWVTKSYQPTKVNPGVLFRLGEAVDVSWWKEGRPATRTEIMESIDSGLPLLREEAERCGQLDQLSHELERAIKLLPAA
jgi:hypothetical protein